MATTASLPPLNPRRQTLNPRRQTLGASRYVEDRDCSGWPEDPRALLGKRDRRVVSMLLDEAADLAWSRSSSTTGAGSTLS